MAELAGETISVPTKNFQLDPGGSKYYLVFSSKESSSIASKIMTDEDNYSVGESRLVGKGWSIGGSYFKLENLEFSPKNETVGFTGQFRINVTAVPEPSSVALLGLGAVGFLLRRRR